MAETQSYYDRFILTECHFQKLKSNSSDSTAYRSLIREAQDENPWAIVRLAECYIKGLRSIDDREQAISRGEQMLKPLAKQGFAFAQLKLAEHYLSVPKRKKAIKLLESCVTARVPEAAELLAELYDEDDEHETAEEYRRLAVQWGGISKVNNNSSNEEEIRDGRIDSGENIQLDEPQFENFRDLYDYYENLFSSRK